MRAIHEPDDHLLFIYGSLLPDLVPPEMASISRQLVPIGEASIRGTLYDLGAYPGVVIDGSATLVRGRIVSVPTSQVWKVLDKYEGCPLPASPDGLFRRVRTKAKLTGSDQPMECWVYVYDRNLNGAAGVAGGCWKTHRSQRIQST